MKCKSCGAPFDENKEDACPYCGAPLPEEVLREREMQAEREREIQEKRRREAEEREQKRRNVELAAEVALLEEKERGLSPLSWIGGVIWVIIGFCAGVLPGIGVIFLMSAAHDEPGFCRNLLRVMNVMLLIFVVLVAIGVYNDL